MTATSTPAPWSIALDPTITLVEVAWLMATYGCRCEFPGGQPTLVPNDASIPRPDGKRLMLTYQQDCPSERQGEHRLYAMFDRFGLCLRVRAIGVP